MCIFAGMKTAAVRMIPVIDAIYRDKCSHFDKPNYANPEKAHLYC